MPIKNTLAFKSFPTLSGITICFSLMTSSCNQLTRYGMNNTSSEQDSNRYDMDSSSSEQESESESESNSEQVEMNFVPTAHFWDSLHLAAEQGDIEKVNQLCADPNVNVNSKNDFDNTPLHLAANNGHTEVVRKLLSMSNIMVSEENVFGKTPLDLALQHGNEDIVALLRSAGAVSGE